jgi:hypothetical protein
MILFGNQSQAEYGIRSLVKQDSIMTILTSDYQTYRDGTIYLQKVKAEPYDLYRCIACWKSWPSTAKKMGHKEAACRRHR